MKNVQIPYDLFVALVEYHLGYDDEYEDHPVIVACERTGYPPGMEPKAYTCPICGAECETVYLNFAREPVGCDVCLEAKDVYDYYEEE